MNDTQVMIENYIREFRETGITVLASMPKKHQAIIINWAQDTVDQYGSALKEQPEKIKKIADLPFSKETIKIAIKTLVPAYVTKSSDNITAMLKDRYIRLSAFQEVKQEDDDAMDIQTNEMNRKSEESDNSLSPIFQNNMQVIISEQKILLEDINTYINDL